MTLQNFQDHLGDFAKDIRLNLASIRTPEGTPDLTPNQAFGILLSCAYATKHPALIKGVEEESVGILSEQERGAAKAAATIMAMNNIYYRFLHLSGDESYGTMPARLRMNVIGSPGIAKADFELYCLAVSAIHGCSICIQSHIAEVQKAGITKLGIQSAIRIASVAHAAAQAASIA